MTIRYDGRVAIVTGGSGALGRSHAMALAARGARVVVNELAAGLDGSDGPMRAAREVADQIRANGGEAFAHAANITDESAVQAMVAQTLSRWGRVDILANNAAALSDRSFQKMTMDEFRHIVEIDLTGYAVCTKAVWGPMREAGYGRVVLTTSSSGLYGNMGQANYSAAKMGLIGLMNTLHLEGAKHNIRVNTLSPIARSPHTEALGLPESVLGLLTAESVTAAMLFLVGEDAPSRHILCAGAGNYTRTMIYETAGVHLAAGAQTPENIAARYAEISSPEHQRLLTQGSEQASWFIARAAQAMVKS